MECDEETVTVEIEDSLVKCNKNLLIKQSDYFCAMFKGNFKESSQDKIKLEGVDLKSFNTILLLIADKSRIICNNELPLVLQAACMLQFNEIRKICVDKILDVLNPTICLNIWKITELLDIYPLCIKAKCMALEEFSEICESKLILEFSLNDVCAYLGNKYLNVQSEILVFQTAMNWWYENHEIYESQDATKVILKLLCCVDFTKLNDNDINEMKTYPDIHGNNELISVLNSIQDLKTNGINMISEVSKEILKYAVHLCSSDHRESAILPCIILQKNLIESPCPSKKFRYSGASDGPVNILMYDYVEGKFTKFFDISEDKVNGLVGANFEAYKEFVFFYGGEYLLGGGNWNRNLWVYDTFKERWERKNLLPHQRRHFGSVMVDDCIYIIGGTGKFRVVQDNFLWYEFKTDTWSSPVPLPLEEHRQLKCCKFNGLLLIVYLTQNCAYFFNKELASWKRIEIVIDKETVVDLMDFTVFSDMENYFYIKGKYLIKFILDKDRLLPVQKSVLVNFQYMMIESVLCNNMVFTLYQCLDRDYDFSYSFEAFDLKTEKIFYIFKDIVQLRDILNIENEEYSVTSHIKLFACHFYNLVRENKLINELL